MTSTRTGNIRASSHSTKLAFRAASPAPAHQAGAPRHAASAADRGGNRALPASCGSNHRLPGDFLRSILIIASFVLVALIATWLSAAPVAGAEDPIETRLYYRAEAAHKQGDLKLAVADCQRVLKLNPRHGGAHFILAQIALQLNKTDAARRHFEAAAREPAFQSRARQALLEMERGSKLTEELRVLQEILDSGIYEQVIDRVSRVARHYPKDPRPLALGIQAAAYSGRFDDADRWLNQLRPISQDQAFDRQLGLLVAAMRNRELAPDQALSSLLAIDDPRLLTPARRRVVKELLISQKRHDEYERLLVQELADPRADQSGARLELGRLHLITGQYQRGLELMGSGDTRSLAENLLFAELLSASGQESRALGVIDILRGRYGKEPELRQTMLSVLAHWCERLDRFPAGDELTDPIWRKLAEEEVQRVTQEAARVPAGMRMDAAFIALHLDLAEPMRKLIPLTTAQGVEVAEVPRLLRLAGRLDALGYRDIGIPWLESAVNQRPDQVELKMALARMYYSDERNSDAEALANEIRQARPDYLDPLLLIVDVMERRSQFYDAQHLLITQLETPGLDDMSRRRLRHRLLRLEATASTTDTDSGTDSQTDTATATDTAAHTGTGETVSGSGSQNGTSGAAGAPTGAGSPSGSGPGGAP